MKNKEDNLRNEDNLKTDDDRNVEDNLNNAMTSKIKTPWKRKEENLRKEDESKNQDISKLHLFTHVNYYFFTIPVLKA